MQISKRLRDRAHKKQLLEDTALNDHSKSTYIKLLMWLLQLGKVSLSRVDNFDYLSWFQAGLFSDFVWKEGNLYLDLADQ